MPSPHPSSLLARTLVQLDRRGSSTDVQDAELKIGDLAKRTGKTQRALRLYEELGLLTPGTRTVGRFRVYGTAAVERVQWIGKLQELGFTLPQIQDLITLTSGTQLPKESMARARQVFVDKSAEVEAQIARLTQLKRELVTSLAYLETCAADCTAESTAGTSCCGTCQTQHARAPSLVHGIQGPPSLKQHSPKQHSRQDA